MFGPVSARQTVIDGNTAMVELMRLHNAAKFFYRVTEQNSADSRTVWLYVSRPSYLDAPILARFSDGIAARFHSRFSFEKREIIYDFFRFQNYFKVGNTLRLEETRKRSWAIWQVTREIFGYRILRTTSATFFFGSAGQYRFPILRIKVDNFRPWCYACICVTKRVTFDRCRSKRKVWQMFLTDSGTAHTFPRFFPKLLRFYPWHFPISDFCKKILLKFVFKYKYIKCSRKMI